MTGFARAQASKKEGGWAVEIRSINHRNFDCSIKAPAGILFFESAIRDMLQSGASRGKITVCISQNGETPQGKTFEVDEKIARSYLRELKKLQKKLGLDGVLSLSELLKLPGVLTASESHSSSDLASWESLKKVLSKALKALLQSRKEEGRKLCCDIETRLRTMAMTLSSVEKLAKGRTQAVFIRLKGRLKELLGDHSADEERLYREAALLAERSDITEEIVRLRSHFDLFSRKIRGTGQVGRELDFLCQEMHREINTIGSKAQLFEIAREVVFLKGEVEKIREQVQNVE